VVWLIFVAKYTVLETRSILSAGPVHQFTVMQDRTVFGAMVTVGRVVRPRSCLNQGMVGSVAAAPAHTLRP
jgi:hypothetical protein